MASTVKHNRRMCDISFEIGVRQSDYVMDVAGRKPPVSVFNLIINPSSKIVTQGAGKVSILYLFV